MGVPDEPTQVMSLDELMTVAAEPHSDTVTTPIPSPLNPAAPPRPAARPSPPPRSVRPPQPVQSAQPAHPAQPVRTEPDLRDRVMTDARRVYDAGLAHGREWLKRGDNALIAWTVAVALLLLLVVAAL